MSEKLFQLKSIKGNVIQIEVKHDGCVQAEANYVLQIVLCFLTQQLPKIRLKRDLYDSPILYNSQEDFIQYLNNLRTSYDLYISKEEYEKRSKIKEDQQIGLRKVEYISSLYVQPGKEKLFWYFMKLEPAYQLFTEWSEKCVEKLEVKNHSTQKHGTYESHNYTLVAEFQNEYAFLMKHLTKSKPEAFKCYDFKSYFYEG
ncbi:MAG: hypothetical protein FGM14_13695 [Flavobacteriales bacterium]|nr:hypothetical protein [Flavobacteriales bacterium]